MSYIHALNIETLKSDFYKIMEVHQLILMKKSVIHENLGKLKKIYNDLIKTNTRKIFLFCLDSFYFQYKILYSEMENLSKSIVMINNRMYADYYKLYHIIVLQNKEKNIQIESSQNISKVPIYKDLEPFHEFRVEDINEIHGMIMNTIDDLYLHYTNLENRTHDFSNSTNVGISITNFFHTLEYENTMLREQLGLYVNYVQFFHSSQQNYLTKLYAKMDMFEREIEDDILTNNRMTQPISNTNIKSFIISNEIIDMQNKKITETVDTISDNNATNVIEKSDTLDTDNLEEIVDGSELIRIGSEIEAILNETGVEPDIVTENIQLEQSALESVDENAIISNDKSTITDEL